MRPESDQQKRARRHFRQRAWERFGLALAAPDIAAIEDRIRCGGGKLVRRDRGRTVHRLKIRGREVFVLFCPSLDCAVTALPRGWARRRKGQKTEVSGI